VTMRMYMVSPRVGGTGVDDRAVQVPQRASDDRSISVHDA
jgi:hypothetical protein